MDTSSFHQTMESLDLPRELYWDLKMEPQSPTSAAVASDLFALTESADGVWLYDDNFANGISLMGEEEEDLVMQISDADNSLGLLGNEELIVEFLDLKDEECLLDQKAHLNCIDYETTTTTYNPNVVDAVGQPIIPITKAHFAAAIAPSVAAGEEYQPVDPSSILQLTPPQSPPQFDGYKQQPELSPAAALVKVEQKQCYATDAIPAAAPATPFSYNTGPWVAGSEIARENQLIDDIVNMRAQELELTTNWQPMNDDCESQASSSMGCGSSSSSSSSRVSGSIADVDEDWLPEQTSSSSSSSPAHTSMENDASMAAPKKRTRTYGRGVEDRKIRKKEQNKNAATRYRQKKKIEMESVLGEEQELTQENEGLRRTLRQHCSEERYLRQLIREFYQKRKL